MFTVLTEVACCCSMLKGSGVQDVGSVEAGALVRRILSLVSQRLMCVPVWWTSAGCIAKQRGVWRSFHNMPGPMWQRTIALQQSVWVPTGKAARQLAAALTVLRKVGYSFF